MKEIADAVEAVSGRPLRRVVGPRRAGDPPALVGSNARAREVLGWTPVRSDIAATRARRLGLAHGTALGTTLTAAGERNRRPAGM